MLPILITESNEAIGESLDIVNHINRIYGSSVLAVSDNPAIETWMKDAMAIIYSLAFPRWAISDFAEFHRETARKYLINKKEAVFGPFPGLLEQTATIVNKINAKLEVLVRLLVQQERDTEHYSLTDIHLIGDQQWFKY